MSKRNDRDYDMGEMWRDHRAMKSKRRYERRIENMRMLAESGLEHSVYNDGTHVRVLNRFDFWPSSGKWYDSETGRRGHHISSLIAYATAKTED